VTQIPSIPFNQSALQVASARRHERDIEQWNGGELLALNQNEAADAPSPAVVRAIIAAAEGLNRYPDHRASALRARLSTLLDVDPSCLIFGNGSYEIIALLGQVLLEPGKVIAIPDPTYSRYRESAMLAGSTVLSIPLRADGANDPKGMCHAAREADVVVVCTPNNPTGAALGAADFAAIAAAMREDAILIVDEAYGDFARAQGGLDAVEALRGSDCSWVVIRTLSKAQGLAGARIGYAVASHPSIGETIDGARGLFNVGRIAQAAALAALDDDAWTSQIIARTRDERERMRDALEALGFAILPSVTNFLCVRVPGIGREWQAYLRERGILVGTIGHSDFANCVRISIGTADETDRVAEAMVGLLD
jgi:histidinol-phosphate aminotransferase